jgi:hypothetical protein
MNEAYDTRRSPDIHRPSVQHQEENAQQFYDQSQTLYIAAQTSGIILAIVQTGIWN